MPHLEYPWGWQDGAGKARALCLVTWAALVCVLPIPSQSYWLNSNAAAPPAYSCSEERGLETFSSAPSAFRPRAHPHQQAALGKRWQTPPQANAKENISPHPPPQHLHPKPPMTFLQCLSPPRAPCWGVRRGKPGSSPALHAALG